MENVLFGLIGLVIGILFGAGFILLIIRDSMKSLETNILLQTDALAVRVLKSQQAIIAEDNRISSRLDTLLYDLQPKTKRRK